MVLKRKRADGRLFRRPERQARRRAEAATALVPRPFSAKKLDLRVATCARWSQLHSRSGVMAVQALTLMIVYGLTTLSVQFIGFLISRLVDYEWPTLGLMTFLILFMAAFGIAWPIAVRIAEFLIRRAGYVVETGQSGGYCRGAEGRPAAT